jgi:hypothetical protein
MAIKKHWKVSIGSQSSRNKVESLVNTMSEWNEYIVLENTFVKVEPIIVMSIEAAWLKTQANLSPLGSPMQCGCEKCKNADNEVFGTDKEDDISTNTNTKR